MFYNNDVKYDKDAIYMGQTYTDVALFVTDWKNAKYAYGFLECGTDVLSLIDIIDYCIDYEKLGKLIVEFSTGGHDIFETDEGYYFIPEPNCIIEV